jgi:AcrR family transcriptional regulator
MCAQRSNRDELLSGAARCLEERPLDQITSRVIAEESGANVASIGYHFGSKDALVTAALVRGLDEWLDEVAERLSRLGATTPGARLREAHAVVTETRATHAGLVRNYVAALGRAPYDDVVRRHLADGFDRARPAIARLIGLGDDQVGSDASGLALALFHGLLIQTMLDDRLGLDGTRLDDALTRLLEVTIDRPAAGGDH